jgi:nitronate monooxygenase
MIATVPVFKNLRLPVIASPMFIVSGPKLVIAQCKAGIVGSMPALNARPSALLDEWLHEIQESVAPALDHPQRPAAPFAVNLVVHKTNQRLDDDLELIVRRKVPIVITSLGAREDVNQAVHGYGGVVLHDVISDRFARKAVEKGADGLIAVAAGAGGHAGTKSPFALVQEIREWFRGLLVLSGAIANGRSILAAQVMGADLAYIGSAFIATTEANAPDAYKQMIVAGNSDDVMYSDFFTGVHGNYLKPSVRAAGLDPDHLPDRGGTSMSFGNHSKPWKDIWGSGHGIGTIKEITQVSDFVDRMDREYEAAHREMSSRR